MQRINNLKEKINKNVKESRNIYITSTWRIFRVIFVRRRRSSRNHGSKKSTKILFAPLSNPLDPVIKTRQRNEKNDLEK